MPNGTTEEISNSQNYMGSIFFSSVGIHVHISGKDYYSLSTIDS